jgi:dTMP kinase
MFLFQALHAQQYALTSDALKRGDTVIADRWDESYLAYHQNFGFLSSQDNLRVTLNSLAFRDRLPDLGFVIHVSIEIARKRRESRGKLERFEDRTDAYYDLVQKTYCEIAAARGWHLLDGRETPEKIHEKIIKFLL